MDRLETIAEVRQYVRAERIARRAVAFVPTMGALHEGHGSCVAAARALGDVVIVSIFVNPAQFGPREDLSKYPRPLEKDLALCGAWGVDAVFVPDAAEIYRVDQDVWVEADRLSKPLCGRARPGHFRGVATVVLKLLNIVQPDTAVFGQKDAQQAVVIREMVEQLDVPVQLVLSPTVRENDGLAMSSRNAYLALDERARAPWIYRSLVRGKELVSKGERDPSRVAGEIRRQMEAHGIAAVEYVELVDARDLSTPRRVEGKVLIAAAARVGTTRLIDNVVLDVREDGTVEETMLF
jgi:pantoate--beta-alanine ligase